MAIYLGEEKINITKTPVHFISGTVRSDDEGIINFPSLSFEPKIITIWDISKIDLKAEAEANGEEWSDDYLIRYVHDGVMLMAVNIDGVWVSQSLAYDSGTIYITNASHYAGINPGISEFSGTGIYYDEENGYQFLLSKQEGQGNNWTGNSDITEREFHYAIYG